MEIGKTKRLFCLGRRLKVWVDNGVTRRAWTRAELDEKSFMKWREYSWTALNLWGRENFSFFLEMELIYKFFRFQPSRPDPACGTRFPHSPDDSHECVTHVSTIFPKKRPRRGAFFIGKMLSSEKIFSWQFLPRWYWFHSRNKVGAVETENVEGINEIFSYLYNM